VIDRKKRGERKKFFLIYLKNRFIIIFHGDYGLVFGWDVNENVQ